MLDIPVLISGGGPVGLAASLFLSQHGVRSVSAVSGNAAPRRSKDSIGAAGVIGGRDY